MQERGRLFWSAEERIRDRVRSSGRVDVYERPLSLSRSLSLARALSLSRSLSLSLSLSLSRPLSRSLSFSLALPRLAHLEPLSTPTNLLWSQVLFTSCWHIIPVSTRMLPAAIR